MTPISPMSINKASGDTEMQMFFRVEKVNKFVILRSIIDIDLGDICHQVGSLGDKDQFA